jgi:hypothetical protein
MAEDIFDACTGCALAVLEAMYVLLRGLAEVLRFGRQFPDGCEMMRFFQLLADLFKVVGGPEIVADAGAIMPDI